MRFQLLGPLAVVERGHEIPIGAPKQRELLLLLVLNRGEVVSTDRILFELWGDDPPAGGVKTLHWHVHQLRRAFADAGVELPLHTVRNGYRLDVDPGQIDAVQFESRWRQAQRVANKNTAEALSMLETSLEMWCGAPLAGAERYLSFAQPEVRRLDALLLGARLDLAELLIDEGDTDSALAHLRKLRPAHGRNERLLGLLMLAVYRSGHHAEALEIYDGYVDELAEEGKVPGPELRAISIRVATHDASLLEPELPSGTVTFLLTDIEGSTRRWESDPEGMRHLKRLHDEAVDSAVSDHGGTIFKDTGDGLFAAFRDAAAALAAAVDLVAELAPASGTAAPVRVAVHTGTAVPDSRDYHGHAVNRCARLATIGHSGQILLSGTTAGVLEGDTALELRDLGVHRLPDLTRPSRIHQVIHPDLVTDFPPLRSLDSFPNNLPELTSSFVGRSAEIESLGRVMAHHRIVSLIGPPGCGKTRLALQAATQSLHDHRDGVWFAAMTQVAADRTVAAELAARLGLHEQPGLASFDHLRDYLRDKQLLLVLDDCDRAVEAVASVASQLLAKCPEIRIMATSRVALEIEGEVVWPVPPLETQTAAGEEDPGPPSDAERLFLERAAASRADEPLAHAPEVVKEICRLVDGIPLAIELAAGKAATLSLEDIRDKLAVHPLGLLKARRRDRPPHQQTLEAAIEWSYELLTPRERTVFDRLAVFNGGFSVDAAEEVCGDDEGDVLDVLDQLRLKSLIIARPEQSRFEMLELIREYAAQRFDLHADQEARRGRHARYFAELSWKAGRRLLWNAKWVEDLRRDLQNVEDALEYLIGAGDADGVKVAGVLDHFWLWVGSARRGLAIIERALQADVKCSDDVRARSLQAAGFLAGIDRRYELAEEYLERSIALYGPGSRGAAWSQFHLARSLTAKWFVGVDRPGDSERAREYFEQAEGTFRAAAEAVEPTVEGQRAGAEGLFGLAYVLPFVALHKALAGRSDAEATALAAEQFGAALGLDRARGMAKANLGIVLLRAGRVADALRVLDEAFRLFREVADVYSLQIVLALSGLAALRADDIRAAREHAVEGLRLMRTQGGREWEALTVGQAAVTLDALGADAGAQRLVRWLDAAYPRWRDLHEEAGFAGTRHLRATGDTATRQTSAIQVAQSALDDLRKTLPESTREPEDPVERSHEEP